MYPTTALKGSDGIKAKVDSKVEKSSVSLLQSYLCIISIINLYIIIMNTPFVGRVKQHKGV